MRVRQGWSGEVAANRWVKYSVELEEDDLRRMLPAGTEPTRVPLVLAYRLLEAEAEMLITAKLVSNHGYAQGKQRLVELVANRAKIISQIKEALG